MDSIKHGMQSKDFVQNCTCTLGIATVPIQCFGSIFEPEIALKKGTIFTDLDLPFFAGGDEIV